MLETGKQQQKPQQTHFREKLFSVSGALVPLLAHLATLKPSKSQSCSILSQKHLGHRQAVTDEAGQSDSYSLDMSRQRDGGSQEHGGEQEGRKRHATYIMEEKNLNNTCKNIEGNYISA